MPNETFEQGVKDYDAPEDSHYHFYIKELSILLNKLMIVSALSMEPDEALQHIIAEAQDVLERAKNPALNDQEAPVDIELLQEKINELKKEMEG